MRKTGATKADLTRAAKNTGVDPDIEPFILRLLPLIPNPYSVFAPDPLHSFALGWVPKMNNMLDALAHKDMKPTDDIKNIADARDRVDARLVRTPPFVGLLRFDTGWWEADTLGATSAAENMSLLFQLCFAFVEDRILIPDDRIRKRVLALHWSVAMFGRELKTPQWYRAQDIERLRARLLTMADEFEWLMTYVGHKFIPGDGMNIPKFHDLMSAAYHIVRFGSLLNGDTGVFERMMKLIKRHDERVGRSRSNDGSERVFCTASAAEFDGVAEAMADLDGDVEDTEAGIQCVGHFTSSHIDIRTKQPFSTGANIRFTQDITWKLVQADLGAGKHGPAIEPRILRELTKLIDEHEFVTSSPQCRYTLQDWYAGNHTVRILKPGHCVQLDGPDSTDFAQILCLNLRHADGIPHADGPRVAVVMFTYRGLHAELPVPHLLRRDVSFIRLRRVHRRAHVVPIFHGLPTGAPCELFPVSFLVNTSVFPCYVAPPYTKIFLSCPKCKHGRLRKPLRSGVKVACPLCKRRTRWL